MFSQLPGGGATTRPLSSVCPVQIIDYRLIAGGAKLVERALVVVMVSSGVMGRNKREGRQVLCMFGKY